MNTAVYSHIICTSLLTVPQKASDLADMINRVIREGLEGLVLKDVKVRWLHHCLLLGRYRHCRWERVKSTWESFLLNWGRPVLESENGFVCPVVPGHRDLVNRQTLPSCSFHSL